MRSKSIFGIILFLFTSCVFNQKSRDKEKIALAEKECSQKTKVDQITIRFYGYFQSEADSINVKIKRGDKIVENFSEKIPEKITDSLRHLREYTLNKEILLTDTLFLKIKNTTVKKVYNFKYLVRPHFTMLSHGWGCDFYELTVDGKVINGGNIEFMKQGWDIIDRSSFNNYYNSGK